MLWVVAGCKNNSTVRCSVGNGNFDSGGGAEANIQNVNTHAQQGSGYKAVYHIARNPGIAANNNFYPGFIPVIFKKNSIGG